MLFWKWLKLKLRLMALCFVILMINFIVKSLVEKYAEIVIVFVIYTLLLLLKATVCMAV